MTGGSFVPDLNPGRASWILLSVNLTEPDAEAGEIRRIIDWRIGLANAQHLVETRSYSESNPDEEPVTSLGSELAKHQNKDVLLITPSSDEIECLRSNLFQNHRQHEQLNGNQVLDPVPRPTLHGYRYLPLREQVEEYFSDPDALVSRFNGEGWAKIDPRDMWAIARTLIPLLPIDDRRTRL